MSSHPAHAVLFFQRVSMLLDRVYCPLTRYGQTIIALRTGTWPKIPSGCSGHQSQVPSSAEKNDRPKENGKEKIEKKTILAAIYLYRLVAPPFLPHLP